MPHIPDSHSTHDPLAIAAYAAGDATGEALLAATELVATCAGCAALHHDLRAIAAALPATAGTAPAPRPRDFRLTAEQAAAIRPTGWRRLLAPLAGPRFAFAGPLGTGLATLGLAGILVAGASGIPLAGSAPQPAAGGATAAGASVPESSTNGVPANDQLRAIAAPASEAPAAQTGPGEVPAPTVLKDAVEPPAADRNPATGPGTGGEGPATGAVPAGAGIGGSPGLMMAAGAAESPVAGEPVDTSVASQPSPPSMRVVVGAMGLLALLAGVILLALRWTAVRRA